MALFDSSVPANSDAVKLGAAAIRAMKATLNTALSTFVNDDGSPKDSFVETSDIQDAAITTVKIADVNITTAKIADGAVTAPKLASGVLHGTSSASAATLTSGPLVVGSTYKISSYTSGDDFTNVGAGSNALNVVFTATGTTPTEWTHGSTLAVSLNSGTAYTYSSFGAGDDFSNVGSSNLTVGPLTIGTSYLITSFGSGDDFTNVGAESNAVGVIFSATGTAPANWTNGTVLVQATFTAAGPTPTTWSHGTVLSFDDISGLAKMQDGFVKTAKIADLAVTTAKIATQSVTTDKIADGSITASKIGSDVPSIAMARWSGEGYIHGVIFPTTNITGNAIRLNANLPAGFPIGGSADTDSAACGVFVQNTTTSGSATGVTGDGVTLGALYYVFATDTDSITLHTSAQGAVDGITDIVTLGGNFTGSNPVFKAFNPSKVFKKGCDLVPIPGTTNVQNIKGYRVIWRTAWSSALAGSIQIAQETLTTGGDNQAFLRQRGTPDAGSAELWYYDSSFTNVGEKSATTIQSFSSYNSIVGFKF